MSTRRAVAFTHLVLTCLVIGALVGGGIALRADYREWATKVIVFDDEPGGPQVVVKPGDSLWKIASTNYPGEHTGKMVYEIRQANPGIDPGRLQIGQLVYLP